jgi:hypothetical protein
MNCKEAFDLIGNEVAGKSRSGVFPGRQETQGGASRQEGRFAVSERLACVCAASAECHVSPSRGPLAEPNRSISTPPFCSIDV